MGRALIGQGFLCIALAAGLAVAQWLWPASGVEFAAQAADRAETWSEAADAGESAPAVARRAAGDAGGCPG